MRTAIVGAGSMGTVMAAYMTRGGAAVEVIDTNTDHVQVMKTQGATVVHREPEHDFTVKLNAYGPKEMSGTYDLVILLTKQTANPVVLPNLLRYLKDDSMVLTMQNGIPEPSVAAVVGEKRTLGGIMLYSGTWLRAGVSAVTNTYELLKRSSFDLGEINGPSTPRLNKVKELLDLVGGTAISDDLMAMRWSKLLINCCASGLSAALNCTFGDVVDNKKSLVAEANIAKECVEMCRAEGYRMAPYFGLDLDALHWADKAALRKTMDTFIVMTANSKAAKASMLQDLEKKQLTEIDYINGYVVACAKKHGRATPFNQRIVELVKEAQERKTVNDFSYIDRFDDLLDEYKELYTD